MFFKKHRLDKIIKTYYVLHRRDHEGWYVLPLGYESNDEFLQTYGTPSHDPHNLEYIPYPDDDVTAEEFEQLLVMGLI